MKLTMQEVIEGSAPLNALAELTDLPWKTRYSLSRILTEIRSNVILYQRFHAELVDRHGETVIDETGKVTEEKRIKLENLADWKRDVAELLALEVEIWGRRMKPDDFKNKEGEIDLSASAMSFLSWLIEPPTDNEDEADVVIPAAQAEHSKVN